MKSPSHSFSYLWFHSNSIQICHSNLFLENSIKCIPYNFQQIRNNSRFQIVWFLSFFHQMRNFGLFGCVKVFCIYIYICMSWDRKVWDRKLKNNSMSPERAHVWLSQITIKQQLYIVTQKKWEKQNKKMIIWMAFVVMYYE